jgi:hypothetical protein
MNKVTMSRWVLGLSSMMMLGALAVGCVGAPAGGDEETATEAPIATEDRAAYTAERLAKFGVEGIEAELEAGTVVLAGRGDPHPEARPPIVSCANDDPNDWCCWIWDDGDIICLPPT